MKDEMKVPGIARLMVGFISARPWVALILGLAIVCAFLPGFKGLSVNFTYRGYFYPNDPMLLDFDKFERQYGNDDSVVLAVHSPSGIFDVESAELIRELTERMWKVPEVIRVDSLANYNWVHAEGDELIVEPFLPDEGPMDAGLLAEREKTALKHEVIPNYLVSEDAKTALIFATVKPSFEAAPNAPLIVKKVREIVADHKKGDHVYYISGGPAVTAGFKEASIGDASLLYPLGFVLTVIFLAIILRSLLGVVLSLFVVFPAIFATVGLMGYAGIEFTNITFIVPQILLAIGVADSVHILSTFYRSMSEGEERRDAAEYALLKNFMPTLITSITTAVGFLSLTAADLKPVVGLGVAAGFGSSLAWLFTYLMLGSLLFILPIRRKVMSSTKIAQAEERATRFTDWLVRNRATMLAGFAVICVGASALAIQNTVDSDVFKYFRKSFHLRIANDFVEENVGGVRGLELSIGAGKEEGIKAPEFLKKVEQLQAWIDVMPEVSRTVSVIDILKMTNRSLHADDQRYYLLPDERNAVAQELLLYKMSLPQGMSVNDRITIKNDAIRLTVLWTLTNSRDVDARIRKIHEKAESIGLSVVVTGKNRIWLSMNGYVVRSFVYSISIAMVLISLILIVFFRSVSLGLLAMLPNAVPLIIGGGVLFLIGKTLDVGVALVTSVCLGIAVDDTIHVLSNYRRLRSEGKTPRTAVIDVLAHTSPALITTSIILICSFGIFVFGTFVPNLYFGLMVAVILSVALITDLTFLPALLLKRPPSSVQAEVDGLAVGRSAVRLYLVGL